MRRLGPVVEHARRVRRGLGSRVNAALLGWPEARVPAGSRVIGGDRIQVGPGFDAFGPVWIEAVTHFAGMDHQPSIRIGARFTVSQRLHLTAVDSIVIGDDVLFGSNVFVGDHGHGSYRGPVQSSPDEPPTMRALSGNPIVIGDRVWLGDNVVVLPGVEIGDGAVVGANSVVSRSVPARAVAIGSPAVPIRQWDDESREWRPWPR